MLERVKRPVRRARRNYHVMRYRWIDDFVFIHINKTGGSSIEHALRIPHEHKTAVEKIAEWGRSVWDRKHSFAVVRNPWAKVVSHYHYRVKTNQTGLGDGAVPFKVWVQRAYRDQDPKYHDVPRMFMPQVDWIVDAGGKIAVRQILRFEDLEAEFAALCRTLRRRSTHLPKLNTSGHTDYTEYYDRETRDIVAACFRSDLERFGYEFGSP